MPTPFRILHVAHGIPSYHNSLLELANKLRSSGIELLTVSHIDLSQILQPAGFIFRQLTDDIELESERRQAMLACRQYAAPSRWIGQLKTSQYFFTRSLGSREFERLVQEFCPDLLLLDMECHRVIVQSYSLEVPVVLLSRWYSVFRHRNAPPMHTSLLPAGNILESMAIRASWMRLRWFKRYLSLRYSLSRQRFRPVTYATNARPALAALARRWNTPLSIISDTGQWLIPHTYENLPVMSLTLDVMEFEAARDPRMHYVGAMVGADNIHHRRFSSGMARLQHFLVQRGHPANPLIYCSLSTYWDTKNDIFDAVLQLFNRRKDLDLVMGLGGRLAPEHWPDTGSNILLLEYAPQISVLRHASIAITHGGVSTINEAIVHGVPLVVVSSDHVDQPGCTARVVYHGVGLSCKARPLDINELSASIDQILSESGDIFRANVSRMQAAQQQLDKQRAAVEFLQSQGKKKC